MSIWHKQATLEALNAVSKMTMAEQLGIEFVEIGDDYLKATMPVDHRTVQPYGIMHGGASATLAESLGSVAGYLCLAGNTKLVVGLEINANHLRPVTGGFVTGVARPIHLGNSTQVWEIRITNEDDKLVCISRLTLAVLDQAAP